MLRLSSVDSLWAMKFWNNAMCACIVKKPQVFMFLPFSEQKHVLFTHNVKDNGYSVLPFMACHVHVNSFIGY